MELNENTDLIEPIEKPTDLHWTTEEEQSFLFSDRAAPAKALIKNYYEHSKPWKSIYYGMGKNDADLNAFIEKKTEEDCWEISSSEYKYLVYMMYDFYRQVWPSSTRGKFVMPKNPRSAWMCYKKTLRDNPNFNEKSIVAIEDSTKYLLSFMVNENGNDVIKRNIDDPVRGIVVGNVQSGKTANMEALIAAASDFRFNFFVVLTGTIENLRKQTRDRITSDFVNKMKNKYHSHYNFVFIDNPCSRSPAPYRLEDLNLESGSDQKYICVCLKNTKRLADLLKWLNKDITNKAKLNVLFIDDEADQASLNTANIDKEKISKINKEIKQITFGYDDKENCNPFGSFVYAGYTATPYGNFLNEASEDTLYPKDFIYGLQTNGDYIGPKQFFGVRDEEGVSSPDADFESLPLVNRIPNEEIEDIRQKTSFDQGTVPVEMGKAILWFLCTVGLFRKWDLKSPVSMLIHTSQKVVEHDCVAKGVTSYLETLRKEKDLTTRIKEVYEEQIKKCSTKEFSAMMDDYSCPEKIKEFPPFEEIEDTVLDVVSYGVKHIQLNEDEKYTYQDGVHLCVDNCVQSKNDSEDMVMRIVYPESKEDETWCPAFIVIGGQTLSRGLTLKGLTVSYFLRSTILADSLMQMGRWFGYRKGYETLERVWLSQKTLTQFEKLTMLDSELRSLIDKYRALNWSPMKYAPQVESFPEYKFLKITSKNKMQKSIIAQCTYANKRGQTTKFFNDEGIIKRNLEKAIKFVNALGPIDVERIRGLENPYALRTDCPKNIWFDQDYRSVFSFLASLKYPKQSAVISDEPSIDEWFEKQFTKGNLKNFNIVIPSLRKGSSSDDPIVCENGLVINPVSRSRFIRTEKDLTDGTFTIPSITGPGDLTCDIDYSKLTVTTKEFLNGVKGKSTLKRDYCGLCDTPLLVLYFLDKKGGKETNITKKEALNLENHLFGYYIYIPCGKDANAAGEFVSVNLEFKPQEEDIEHEI